MSYIENPKTKGSGIICCIPQRGRCPVGCADCFFQSGRSYLEPLKENVPNMPDHDQTEGRVVRVNDGNDSHHQQDWVIESTYHFRDKFYNTSFNKDLGKYPGPVVLTLNPGTMTDHQIHIVPDDQLKHLMAVRFRVNTWNLGMARLAVQTYAMRDVAVFMTFMAYHELTSLPPEHLGWYDYRKRTLNSYYAISEDGLKHVLSEIHGPRVYTCGEGWQNKCKDCGNCLREYYRWKEAHANSSLSL